MPSCKRGEGRCFVRGPLMRQSISQSMARTSVSLRNRWPFSAPLLSSRLSSLSSSTILGMSVGRRRASRKERRSGQAAKSEESCRPTDRGDERGERKGRGSQTIKEKAKRHRRASAVVSSAHALSSGTVFITCLTREIAGAGGHRTKPQITRPTDNHIPNQKL